MSESLFKIRERTAIIFGPINSIVQTLGNVLQEQGADVAFLDEKASDSQRFVNNLMDMRQVHNHYGRAAAIDCKISSASEAKEALSRAAELFGSVDIFIDANMGHRDLTTDKNSSFFLTHEVSEFFKGRGKGRNIYLAYDESICKYTKAKPLIENNKILNKFIKQISRDYYAFQITSNIISLPFTDEFLLEQFPQNSVQKSFDDIKQNWSEARLANPVDVAYSVAFLASPMSAAIDGQLVRATYGME